MDLDVLLNAVTLSNVMTFVVAGLGAYFGAYLRKKAENRAIHEDLAKLLEQVRAVTKTTKEIEAKISNEVWDRQKRWEVKKEVIFEVMRVISALQSSLNSLHATYKVTAGGESWRAQKRIEASADHGKIYDDFNRAIGLAEVVCSAIVCEHLSQLRVTATSVPMMASADDAEGAWAKVTEFAVRVRELQTVIRSELEMGPV